MTILQQKKVKLENDVTTGKNPDSSLGIYLTVANVSKYILVDDNSR